MFERDVPPPEGNAEDAFFLGSAEEQRSFGIPHAFLGLMCSVLGENYPDLLDELLAAGARKMTFADMVPKHLANQYQPEPGDEKLWMLLCRRATIETVLRRYVEREANLTIRSQTFVTDVLVAQTQADTGEKTLTVTGLELTDRQNSNAKSIHSADIVVNASGRADKFYTWLKAKGAQITEQRDDAEIVYYTRHYALRDGVDEPERDSDNPSAGDLGYLKYGVFPGDNGHFAIILCLPNNESELREAVKNGDKFDQICMNIPGLVPWISSDKAIPTTAPFGIGEIHAVWRDYIPSDTAPKLLNYFAVGDAAARTNPLYGRGCSTGTLHAHLLSEVLSDESDPWQRALAFRSKTEEEIRPIFNASLKEDKNGIKKAEAVHCGQALDKANSIKHWFGLAFSDAWPPPPSISCMCIAASCARLIWWKNPAHFCRTKKFVTRCCAICCLVARRMPLRAYSEAPVATK